MIGRKTDGLFMMEKFLTSLGMLPVTLVVNVSIRYSWLLTLFRTKSYKAQEKIVQLCTVSYIPFLYISIYKTFQ